MAQLDMTRGPVPQNLARYAGPLILGNLFQLSYNLVDSVIAGRFIGQDALAAAGTASPIMNILILGISGLSLGAGVLMSEFFGAGEREKLKRELSTVLLFGLFFSLALVCLGVAVTRPLLVALQVPVEILPMTCAYVRVIFLGVPFTYFYNTLAAALKSVGDAKTPLKFLVFSACLNAALDLIFIAGLGFGLVCSAVTTVVAEGASALLSALYIYGKVPGLALGRGELGLDKTLLKITLRYGSATALQQSCQPIGKLLVQRCVNGLGVEAMAAFNAVTRIDDFAFTPQQSIAQAITTFVAQHRGRGVRTREERRRVYTGFRWGLALELGYFVCICLVAELLKEPIMRLFLEKDSSPLTIQMGCQYLTAMGVLYILPAMTNGVQGFFRGCGRMKLTLLCTFIQVFFRVSVTYALAPEIGISGVAVACCIGWVFMLEFEGLCYLKNKRQWERGERPFGAG